METARAAPMTADGRRDEPEEAAPPAGSPSRWGSVEEALVGLLLLLVGAFLLVNLRTYAGALLVWEPAVLDGLESSFLARESPLGFFLRTLTWDDGLVSKGDWSPLYGAPAYALVTAGGFDAALLRLPSVGAALLTLLAAAILGRKLLGRGGAIAFASALALSPAVLFYGRYGTSLAATTLTVLIAAGLAILFLEATERLLRRAAVLGAALAMATLHYAPGRLAVLFLVLFLPAGALLGRPEVRKRRFQALGVLVLLLGGFWGAQVVAGRSSRFLHARGEQLLNFLEERDYVASYLGRPVEPGSLTPREKLAIARNVAVSRVPELLRAIEPSWKPATPVDLLGSDPPRLPFLPLPLLVPALWGLARSLRHPRRPRTLIPLGLTAALTAPLLLTTRVDAHRLCLLVVPIGLWAADGAVDLCRRLPRPAGVAAAIVLALAGVPHVYRPLHVFERPDVQPLASSLSVAVERASRPVMLAVAADHSVVGLIRLQILERQRQARLRTGNPDPGTPSLVAERVVTLLREGSQEDGTRAAEELAAVLQAAPMLLGPLDEFPAALASLKKAGQDVTPVGTAEAPFVLVSRPSAPAGEQVVRPVPAPRLETRPGRLVFLSDLSPVQTESELAPPRMDATWDGSPLEVAGTRYQKGIGMHSRCSMTFAVPEGAVRFQARAGLGPGASSCPQARAGFFVKDQDGNILFSLPSLALSASPVDVAVPLAGVRSLTLVASEGGNGRDCDHANWALASFVTGGEETTSAASAGN
ncbi:hypothetical protein FBQ97_07755 [Acidobacteria bacterium ACD]|nr:hypothetical protein [Acidobacteria bacterium ACD]